MDGIADARKLLSAAKRIAAFTGAGISAESGVPTFRGAGGLWKQFRAEDLATPEAFARDPKLVWEWYDWRRQAMAKVSPNPGHMALVELEARAAHFTLITQNVDGLHDRAGSRSPAKLHGDIWEVRCTGCDFAARDERAPLPQLPPRCDCGEMLRPCVVWFGEALPRDPWDRAFAAAQTADLLLVVGTSAVVYPAAGLIDVARSAGARIIEINPDATHYSAGVDVSIRGKAGEVLPELLRTPD